MRAGTTTVVAVGMAVVLAGGLGVLATVVTTSTDSQAREPVAPVALLSTATEQLDRAAVDGYRFAVEGETEIRMPTEVTADQRARERLERRAEELAEELQRRVGEARADAPVRGDGLAEEIGEEMADRLRKRVQGLPTLPDPAALGRFAMTFEGHGVGVVGRTRANFTYERTAPTAGAGDLEVITVGQQAYLRTPETDQWVRMPEHYRGLRFSLMRAPVLPEVAAEYLREVEGPVRELGYRDSDGVRLRGIALGGDGRPKTEVWVGADDGILREITWRAEVDRTTEAGSMSLKTRTTVRLFDFGAQVTVNPPAQSIPFDELAPDRRPPFTLGIGLDAGP